MFPTIKVENRSLKSKTAIPSGRGQYVRLRHRRLSLVAVLIPELMVIVVDASAFVSACLGTGAASEVVAACLRGEHEPLMGAALLAEYDDVLGRSALFRSFRLSAEERDELLDIFVAHCRWTRIYFGWRPNLADEADNHLVELAVAGGAERIVTGNVRDLAGSELQFPGLRAVTPAHFLKEARR